MDNRAMYTITLHWNQGVREQVYQDESRYLGTQRVESTINVIATSQSEAEDAVKRAFSDGHPVIVGVTVRTPIHFIVEYKVHTSSLVLAGRVLEPLDVRR